MAREVPVRGNGPMPLIDRVLAEVGATPDAVQCMAVGLGPGSYTGIRSAIAITQGWQLARPITLAGVSSVACLAHQAWRAGLRGNFQIAIDAQRNECYLAAYLATDSGPQEREPMRIVPRTEIGASLSAGKTVIGPEIVEWFAAGQRVEPDAATLASLVAGDPERFTLSTEALEPIYLRKVEFVKSPPGRPGAPG
jgi:tRNA threonylcarbamoyl adenosine modification protein YeaZ